jgi:hypothetical protein
MENNGNAARTQGTCGFRRVGQACAGRAEDLRQGQLRDDVVDRVGAHWHDARWCEALPADLGAVGKQADLVVLDRNLFDVPSHDIHKVRVMLTLMDGKVTYRAADSN